MLLVPLMPLGKGPKMTNLTLFFDGLCEPRKPEGMPLTGLFALVEAIQASLSNQDERLAWLQQAVASLSEHLLCEPPPRPVGAATDG